MKRIKSIQHESIGMLSTDQISEIGKKINMKIIEYFHSSQSKENKLLLFSSDFIENIFPFFSIKIEK